MKSDGCCWRRLKGALLLGGLAIALLPCKLKAANSLVVPGSGNAEEGLASPSDAKYYSCRTGALRFDDGAFYCVAQIAWPSIGTFWLAGEKTESFAADIAQVGARIKRLTGVTLQTSTDRPDILLIFGARNSNPDKEPVDFIDVGSITFDAHIAQQLSYLFRTTKGCLSAPFPPPEATPMAQEIVFAELDAAGPLVSSELAHDCARDTVLTYFGIHPAYKQSIDGWSFMRSINLWAFFRQPFLFGGCVYEEKSTSLPVFVEVTRDPNMLWQSKDRILDHYPPPDLHFNLPRWL
jgi:hypothetical protein